MKVISVNVGLPREVAWERGTATTAIYKQPIDGRVKVRRLNLDGDRQADLSVHGGPNKAAYAYPAEHYPFWRSAFPQIETPYGMFGENLTIEGILEDQTHIGDRLRIGTAEFAVTQPRIPCYKLGIKFGRQDIVPRFLKSLRSGFYLAVLEEGDVAAGDTIEVLSRAAGSVTVADVVRLYADRQNQNADLFNRALRTEALPADWRDYFARRIEEDQAGA